MISFLERKVYELRLQKRQAYFRDRFIPKRNPIIISAFPRGGSTWLFEVIQKATNSFSLWEPLHPKNLEAFFPNTNQWFDKFADKNDDVPELVHFLNAVLNGKFINESLIQKDIRFKSYKTTEFLLIKFCRLTPLLPWFMHHFKDYRVVQLYRNPLAVISSQIEHGAWKLKKEYRGYPLTGYEYCPEYYFQFRAILENIKTPEEFLAAQWAMDTIPFPIEKPEGVLSITYEDLYTNPVQNFTEVFNFIKITTPDNIEDKLKTPSSITKNNSSLFTEPEKQLSAWKKRLNSAQENRIRILLEKFGFYEIGETSYLNMDKSLFKTSFKK